MKLYLMRHAKPEEKDPETYPDDSKRPLSREGREVHRYYSALLRGMGIKIDKVMTSPHTRARETAQITAEALGFKKELEETDVLGSGFTEEGVLDLVGKQTDGAILCVGHAPDMGKLATVILGAQNEIQFKKGAIMGIEFEGKPSAGGGNLLFFYDPEQLLCIKEE